MAFAWCVRRSASKLGSLCDRVRSIPTAVNHPSLTLTPSHLRPLVSRGFIDAGHLFDSSTHPSNRLSSDKPLHRVIDSKISDSKISSNDEMLEIYGEYRSIDIHVGKDFPFSIVRSSVDEGVVIAGTYNGENIEGYVGMPCLDDDAVIAATLSLQKSFPLLLTVTKKSGCSLKFTCSLFADYIEITGFSVRGTEEGEKQKTHEWPNFINLDDDMKKAFHEYLENRSLDASTTRVLHKYMVGKMRLEYLKWLKNVKKFLDE